MVFALHALLIHKAAVCSAVVYTATEGCRYSDVFFSLVETWAKVSLTCLFWSDLLFDKKKKKSFWLGRPQMIQYSYKNSSLHLRPYTYVLLRRFYFANANLNALLGLWENNASRFWSKVFKNTNEIFIGNIEPISAFILQRDEESGRPRRFSLFPPSHRRLRSDGMGCAEGGPQQLAAFSSTASSPAWQNRNDRKSDNSSFKI